MIGLWAPQAERVCQALGAKGLMLTPLIGEGMLEAIRSVPDVKQFILAPNSDSEAELAERAKNRDPDRVLIVAGFANQGWSGLADVGPPLNLDELANAIQSHFLLVRDDGTETDTHFTAQSDEIQIQPTFEPSLASESPQSEPAVDWGDPEPLPEAVVDSFRLDEVTPVESQASNYPIEVTNEGFGEAKRGKLLAVIAKKGGVGKTTMSLVLAHHLAKHLPNRSVLHIDGNVQQADVTTALFSERNDVTAMHQRSGEPSGIADLANSVNLRRDLKTAVEDYPRGDVENLQFLLGVADDKDADPDVLNPDLFRAVVGLSLIHI